MVFSIVWSGVSPSGFAGERTALTRVVVADCVWTVMDFEVTVTSGSAFRVTLAVGGSIVAARKRGSSPANGTSAISVTASVANPARARSAPR
jgi:hypothetical protein